MRGPSWPPSGFRSSSRTVASDFDATSGDASVLPTRVGPRRGALQAKTAFEPTVKETDDDARTKRKLLRRVSFFAEFNKDERDAVVGAMRLVEIGAGEVVMTHLPRVERNTLAQSSEGKTADTAFKQNFIRRRGELEKEKSGKLKPEKSNSSKNETELAFAKRDAWWVLARGTVDVHAEVVRDGDVGDGRSGDTGDGAPRIPGGARSNWRRAFSATSKNGKRENENLKRKTQIQTLSLPPVAVSLGKGSFFGSLDAVFQCDPGDTVVFKASTDCVLFAIPGERFWVPEIRLAETNGKGKGTYPSSDDDSDSCDEPTVPRLSEPALWAGIETKVKQHRERWSVFLNRFPIVAAALTPFQVAFLCAAVRAKTCAPFHLICSEDVEGKYCVGVMHGDIHATARVAGDENEDDDESFDVENAAGTVYGDDEFKVSQAKTQKEIETEIWKRAFGPGEVVGECVLSFTRNGLVWESNVRAGADGAEVCLLGRESFREMFGKSAETVARFETAVDEVERDTNLGPVGFETPNEDDDVSSNTSRSTAAASFSPSSRRGGTGSVSEKSRSVSGKSSAFNFDADEDDATLGTPRTPSPRRQGASREVLPPALIPRTRKQIRVGLGGVPDRGLPKSVQHPEEWETDSETERGFAKQLETQTMETQRETSALATLRKLRVGGLGLDLKHAACSAPRDASSVLRDAFADAKDFSGLADSLSGDGVVKTVTLPNESVIKQPLRPRNALGPAPDTNQRRARLLEELGRCDLFTGCEMRVLRLAVADLELVLLRPSQVLYHYGSTKRDYLYIVEAGEVQAVDTHVDDPGSKPARDESFKNYSNASCKILHRAGEVFGANDLVYRTRRTHTVTATEKGAKLWGMRTRWFERLRPPIVQTRRNVFVDVVAPTPVFNNLPSTEKVSLVELFAELGETITFDRGDVVVAQGETPACVYVVITGTAVAKVAVPTQTENSDGLEVARFKKGSTFGWLEFLVEEDAWRNSGDDDSGGYGFGETCDVPYRASVVAATEMRCAVIDGRVFFKNAARAGSVLRESMDRERSAFANGVA